MASEPKSNSWYHRNKDKAKAANKKWREANREYDKRRKRNWYYAEGRKRDLMKLYGLSMEDYQIILDSQNGTCALCDSKDRLSVDHNHSTGEVRGLLCYDCNRNFIADYELPDKFLKAAEYLTYSWHDGKRTKI